MKIDRHNYEEYFNLYMDNELSSGDRREVEAFVQLHPDLKEELDLLLQFKLVPDNNIVFAGKEELLKINGNTPITLTNYEEWFTLYIDNELTAGQKKSVEQFITENPSLEKELALFQQTKLQPEDILFTNKESLYRKEEQVRRLPVRWWRIAAAAILIMGIGFATYSILNKKSASDTENMANSNRQNTNTENPVAPKENTIPVKDQLAIEDNMKENSPVTEQQNENKNPGRFAKVIENKNKVIPENKNKIVSPLPFTKEEPVVVDNNKPSNNLPAPENNSNFKNILPKDATASIDYPKDDVKLETSSDNNVTNKSASPSDPVMTASLTETDGKKSKLRGLFRKVTRTFDKRTSADDDDQLLVAGLSIKLR